MKVDNKSNESGTGVAQENVLWINFNDNDWDKNNFIQDAVTKAFSGNY